MEFVFDSEKIKFSVKFSRIDVTPLNDEYESINFPLSRLKT
jgi:hypothetical protein